MKTEVVKIDEVNQIIYDYWNQMGNTITEEARDHLIEQIGMCSFEIEAEEIEQR